MRLPWLADVALLEVRSAPVNDVILPDTWADLLAGRRMAGATLAAGGLPLPPMRPESAWVVELNAIVGLPFN